MIGLIFLIAVLVGALIWLRFSIWRVKPGEVGVKAIRGSLGGICRPGFHFVPKLFGHLLKISPRYKIDFATITAYSKNGPDEDSSDYESQPLTVAVSLYLKFPQTAFLRDIIQSGMPTSQDGLLKFFDPIVSEETKEAMGQLNWKEAMTRTETIRYLIECGLAARRMITDFVTCGGTFEVAIEEVSLPDLLKQALACRDQMKIGSEAVKKLTDARGTPTKNFSSIGGQVFDGRTTRFLNLTADGPDSRTIGQMFTAASRMTQQENGQSKKGKGFKAPDNFKFEDVNIT